MFHVILHHYPYFSACVVSECAKWNPELWEDPARLEMEFQRWTGRLPCLVPTCLDCVWYSGTESQVNLSSSVASISSWLQGRWFSLLKYLALSFVGFFYGTFYIFINECNEPHDIGAYLLSNQCYQDHWSHSQRKKLESVKWYFFNSQKHFHKYWQIRCWLTNPLSFGSFDTSNHHFD